MKLSTRFVVLAAVLALYLTACFTPAVIANVAGFSGGPGGGRIVPPVGWLTLIFGWIVPVPWSANFFLLAGLILLMVNRPVVASVLGIVASLLGLTAWLHLSPNWDKSPLESLLVGYYLWQVSLIALPLGITGALCIKAVADRRRMRFYDRICAGLSALCVLAVSVEPAHAFSPRAAKRPSAEWSSYKRTPPGDSRTASAPPPTTAP
jgi:hypothetical protein